MSPGNHQNSRESGARAPGEPPHALVTAIRQVLRPLVRLLLTHGLTLPFLSRLLKTVYVEVAVEEFPVAGRAQSDSRVSLLTGIHRKDVRRLRAEAGDVEPAPESLSVGTQLVTAWVSERRYLDASGAPKALPLRPRGARKVSFEELVRSVSRQDLRPRVVLDELVRLGIVEVDEQEIVRLKVEAFVPRAGFDEKAFYFGQNVRDHIAAGVHNLEGRDPARLERSVFYHGLEQAEVEELAALAEELGMQALKAVNQRAMAMKRRRSKGAAPASTARMNFGVYFHTDGDPARGDGGDDDA